MKLLIVPGYAESLGEANWICLKEITKALAQYKDLEIDIAGATLSKEKSYVGKKNPCELIKKIINWPVINPKASEKCYQELIDKLKGNIYDAVLVMHMPYDGVLAAVRAKKRFPGIRLFLYELDPITYEIDKQRKSLGRYLYILRVRAEKRTFAQCDKILHMECNREKYSQKEYDKYRKKFEYIDFPLIHHMNNKGIEGKVYQDQKIKLIYTGKLMTHFRSPAYLLEVLAEVKKSVDIQVLFFSQGDCEKMIYEFKKQHSFIEQRGYVDKDTLSKEMADCDYLINIGNKMSEMLPSKLLTYIETGMPILHVKNQEKDACVTYLDKYDLSLIIDESEPISVSVERTVEFLKENYGKRLESDVIVKNYLKNTPEYSAKSIYDMMAGNR